MTSLAGKIDWDKVGGLLPAIVQDAVTGRVLMLGYMNQEALEKTLSGRKVTFFSRSRNGLWTKGETSGNALEIRGQEIDCDGDTILIQASPSGPTCHLDRTSCFDDAASGRGFGFIGALECTLDQRMRCRPPSSYTAALAQRGTRRIAQKIGEEGVELALAATAEDPGQVVTEAADLVYHLLVLLRQRGLQFGDVARELERRHRS